MKISRFRVFAISAALAVALGNCLLAQEAMNWEDASGKFSIVAEFVRLDGANVVLKRDGGKEITVALSKLNSASQRQAKAAAAKMRSQSKEQLDNIAPTPTPSTPSSNSSTSLTSIPENMEIEAFMKLMLDSAKQKKVDFAWDLLPPSYQKDVQEIVQLVGTKFDPGLHSDLVTTKKRLISVLKSKKNFVLNSQMIPIPKDPKFGKAYDPFVKTLDAVLDLEEFAPAKLQKGDIQALLNGYANRTLIAMEELGRVLADLKLGEQQPLPDVNSVSYTIEKVSANEAIVRYRSAKEKEQEITLVLFEGHWLPKDMVEKWDENIAEVRSKISQLDANSQNEMRAGLKSMNQQFLTGIERASNQQQFDQALGPLGMMMMMFGGGMGAGMGMPGMGMPMPGPGMNLPEGFPGGLPGGVPGQGFPPPGFGQ